MVNTEQNGISPIFNVDVGLPTLVTTCSEAEAWDDVDRAKKVPKGNKPMVVPLVRVINGVVQNVIFKILPTSALLQKKNIMVFDLNKVFHAATTQTLTFREDFRQFYFREGSLKSNWVAASKLDVKFWKSYGSEASEREEMTTAEREALEAHDFVIQIVITPEKDPAKVSLNWVCLPVEEENFKKLPEHKTAKSVRRSL